MLTVILISYLVIMFGVSVWANKFNSSAEDFLLAGRRLGVFLAAFTLAATYFGGGYVVGLGAEAYSSGMIAWYNGLAGAVGILAVCLVLKKMEGMQLYTVAELLETRYGSPLLSVCNAVSSGPDWHPVRTGEFRREYSVFHRNRKSGCGRSNRRCFFYRLYRGRRVVGCYHH